MTRAGEPNSSRAANGITSARMKPFSMSEWTQPTALGAGVPAGHPGPHPAHDGIKGHQTQQPGGLPDEAGHAGFGKTQTGQEFLALLGGESLKFRFQVPQDGHHRQGAAANFQGRIVSRLKLRLAQVGHEQAGLHG